MNSEEEKQKGNNFYQKKNYQQAIIHYTNAINIGNSSNLHIYYTNRSLTFFHLKNYKNSLEDAEEAIKIEPNWSKAHFRKLEVLISSEKFHEANETLKKWISLINEQENKTKISEISLKLHKKWVEFDFETITKEIPQITVNYINHEKGKGVFSNKSYKFGEIIFIEEPLISHRCIDQNSIQSCSHCIRSFLSPKLAFPKDKKFIDKNSYDYISEPLNCNFCQLELYCSEKCKNESWKKYHQYLCNRGKIENEEMIKLKKIAFKLNRTNPLLISRMFAMMAGRMKNFENEKFVVEKSFEIFSRFIQNEEFHEGDEECFTLIKTQILKNDVPKEIEKCKKKKKKLTLISIEYQHL